MCGEQLQVDTYQLNMLHLEQSSDCLKVWPTGIHGCRTWRCSGGNWPVPSHQRCFWACTGGAWNYWVAVNWQICTVQCSKTKRRLKQRQGHVSNAVHPRAGLTGLAGGPGSPADAPRGKPTHDDASPAGQTLKYTFKTTKKIIPFRTLPCCLQWTLPRSLQLSNTAQFRLTLHCRYPRHSFSVEKLFQLTFKFCRFLPGLLNPVMLLFTRYF